MDQNKAFVLRARAARTVEALEKNGMPARYVETKEEAVQAVKELLREGDAISCGGSMTLAESGVRDLMKSGAYHFLDRETAPAEEVYRAAFSADVFLTSANAVTEHGELYNVDGNGNRVAALIYGPKKVIVVAGVNKLVRDLDAAMQRVKEIAAPANGVRLNTETPCEKTGVCIGCDKGLTDGCRSPKRMCCHYVVTGFQRTDRIHVILVGEELGY